MITVAYSTKKIREQYIEDIKNSSNIELEIATVQNNNFLSLTEFYNIILKSSKNDIIVLCHDDLIFETYNWTQKIINHFNNSPYGIIGVAGTKHLSESGVWWEHCNPMYGIVNHIVDGKKQECRWSHETKSLEDMVVVDGLFLAIHKKRIKNYFDESIKGFHYYDLDFCFSNFLNNVKIGLCTDIRLTHFSSGSVNSFWEENRNIFVEKYKNNLPIDIRKNKIELLPSMGPFCPDK